MELQERIQANIDGETWEVTYYLALAHQADHEGLPEVADALRRIAADEANHGARFIFLEGKAADLKGGLEKMLKGERMAFDGKHEGMRQAEAAERKEMASWFDTAAHDEARHAKMLEGLLKKYFEA